MVSIPSLVEHCVIVGHNQGGESARDTRGFKKDDMVASQAGQTKICRTMSSRISHAVSHHSQLEVGM